MTIRYKTKSDIKKMAEGGKLLAQLLAELKEKSLAGLAVIELEMAAFKFVKKHNLKAAFQGYLNYPDILCLSINEQVVHTPPSLFKERKLVAGDLVSIDCGFVHQGLYTDSALSFFVPGVEVPKKSQKLLQATEESLLAGIEAAQVGNFLSDIGRAVASRLEAANLGVIRDLVGHGVGFGVHEEPKVPNFWQGQMKAFKDLQLEAGLVLAIEPMATLGGVKIKTLADGFTIVTKDGSLSAHVEHTVAITDQGPQILTKL